MGLQIMGTIKPKAAVGSKEYVRGSSAFTPFTPGMTLVSHILTASAQIAFFNNN